MKQIVLKIFHIVIAFFTKIYLKRTRPLIIGITGSVGKTSCRMIVTQVLQQLLPEKTIYTSPKNFNSEIGLILSIFQIESYEAQVKVILPILFRIIKESLFWKKKSDIIVLEYGIDHPHDMKYLTTVARADIAIFTKLDAVHSAYFSNIEAIGDEKFLLLKTARKRVYLNAFDDYCKAHAENLHPEHRFYNAGNLELKNLRYETSDTWVLAVAESGIGQIKTNLMGAENLAYILIGMDIASYIWDISVSEKELLFSLKLQAWRFSVFSEGENIFIDSTYNAAPESMKVMIENAKHLRNILVPDYKVGYLIGDMRELGENSKDMHLSLVSHLMEADYIFTVWAEMKSYVVSELLKNGFKGLLKDFLSSREAGKELKVYLESIGGKSVTLFKGSQNTIFTEEALKEVLNSEVDKKKLVRQSQTWIEKKEQFFQEWK